MHTFAGKTIVFEVNLSSWCTKKENIFQNVYNLSYKVWAIMVLLPLVLTIIIVLMTWVEVSLDIVMLKIIN